MGSAPGLELTNFSATRLCHSGANEASRAGFTALGLRAGGAQEAVKHVYKAQAAGLSRRAVPGFYAGLRVVAFIIQAYHAALRVAEGRIYVRHIASSQQGHPMPILPTLLPAATVWV